MRDFNRGEPPGFSWAYRDLLTALLVVFIAMAALSLISVTQKQQRAPIQGNLIIVMRWQLSSASDIDLWVQSPGDAPVGFLNKNGLNCNLVRDDLGRGHDPSSANEEMMICRNAPPGDYTINVMAYRVYDNNFPIRVTVDGMYSSPTDTNPLFNDRAVNLTYAGEERTVIRFRLTKGGWIENGSINAIPVRLYRGAGA